METISPSFAETIPLPNVEISSASINTSFDDILSTDEHILSIMESIQNQFINTVMPYLSEKYPNLVLTATNINQQLELMKSSIAPDKFSSSNPLDSSTTNNARRQICDILSPPQPFQRSENRRVYKARNYGIMTSEEMIGEYQSIENERQQAVTAKEQKKNEQQERKKLNEVIKNIKKEKAVDKKRKKLEKEITAIAEDSPPKKRGRKPKAK